MMGDLFIFPMMELLGIDANSQQQTQDRSWLGVKCFLEEKLTELERCSANRRRKGSGRDRLVAAVMEEIVETVKEQMEKTDYFTSNDLETDDLKYKFAPITNLGCESEFAKLDNRIKVTGGSTSIQTLSKKMSLQAVNS